MLTFEEFMDKNHIILDKCCETFILEKDYEDKWHVFSIIRSACEFDHWIYSDEEAYEFYKERMESYGFKRFPIIIE